MTPMPARNITAADSTLSAERMSQAKARLILTQGTAFFGALACSMDFVERADLNPPTMATDGAHVYYHPQFVADHDDDEVLFVVCHEVMHVALVHMFRLRGLDPHMANVAADYAINEILCIEGIGKMPKIGLRDSALYAEGEGTMEGIYAILQQRRQKQPPDQPGDQPGPGGQKRPGGKPGDGPKKQGKGGQGGLPDLMDALLEPGEGQLSDAERAMKEADTRLKVTGAMQAAALAGSLPGSLKRLLAEALEVKTPWQALLREFFTERTKEYRSWAKPNRRFAAQGILMPGRDGHRMGVACTSADASGSIDQRMYDLIGAEMNKIIADVSPKLIHFSYFDTCITDEVDLVPDAGDVLTLTTQAGGGTNFAPVMDWCMGKEDPACLIILTDGYCSSFGRDPGCPVLWAVIDGNTRFDPPFGTVIQIAG
jgi:predicted metal-dependent peptidase